ncbi:MAG: hypothetical protein M3Q31_10625 [Actinomycetota bacterium]|nr:hypothetical protein [Actinomycetota bacterium]
MHIKGSDPFVCTAWRSQQRQLTRVVLEQRDHDDQAGRDSHGRGWRGCLDSLERLLGAG